MLIQKNIYSDLNFFISKNDFTNDFSIRKDQNSIKQSVKNIILTSKGERPLEPSFGTDINNIIFEQPYLIEFYGDETIRLALSEKEPRITVLDVTYEVDVQTVTIQIDYVINSLNVKDTVSLTLERTR